MTNRTTFQCLNLLACMALSACGPGEREPAADTTASGAEPPKVLLVGIDGATWTVLDRMLERGELPTLARMTRSGARGVLRSIPPLRSPAIWTTIATGRERARHGIRHFYARHPQTGERRLVRSLDRRVGALWNWMGDFGLSVGFVGWWASWPAEPVERGWIVTDRLTRDRFLAWSNTGSHQHGLTYPPELAQRLSPEIVAAEDLSAADVAELVELTEAEAHFFDVVDEPIKKHGLSMFRFAYAAQRTYENVAFTLLAQEQPDLTGLFLIANDPVCHTFWHFWEPEAFEGVDPVDARRLGRIVEGISRHNDHVLARLLEIVGEDTAVFVVSDHGFQASGELPQVPTAERYAELRAKAREEGVVAVGQSGMHHEDGILVAWGPGVRRVDGLRATILDVAPTVLALMGLPVPEDFEGRVLEELIEPEHLRRFPVRSVPTFEKDAKQQRPDDLVDPGEEETLEQLRGLGYIK